MLFNCIRNVKELLILKDFCLNIFLKVVVFNDKMVGLNNSWIWFLGWCSVFIWLGCLKYYYDKDVLKILF